MLPLAPEVENTFKKAARSPEYVQFTESGLDCLLVKGEHLTYCGYVFLPDNHDLAEEGLSTWINEEDEHKYKEEYLHKCKFLGDIEVHGGITWNSEMHSYSVNNHVFAIGYDCRHCDDLEFYRGSMDELKSYGVRGKIWRDLDYNMSQVRNLAKQIAEYNPLSDIK